MSPVEFGDISSLASLLIVGFSFSLFALTLETVFAAGKRLGTFCTAPEVATVELLHLRLIAEPE